MLKAEDFLLLNTSYLALEIRMCVKKWRSADKLTAGHYFSFLGSSTSASCYSSCLKSGVHNVKTAKIQNLSSLLGKPRRLPLQMKAKFACERHLSLPSFAFCSPVFSSFPTSYSAFFPSCFNSSYSFSSFSSSSSTPSPSSPSVSLSSSPPPISPPHSYTPPSSSIPEDYKRQQEGWMKPPSSSICELLLSVFARNSSSFSDKEVIHLFNFLDQAKFLRFDASQPLLYHLIKRIRTLSYEEHSFFLSRSLLMRLVKLESQYKKVRNNKSERSVKFKLKEQEIEQSLYFFSLTSDLYKLEKELAPTLAQIRTKNSLLERIRGICSRHISGELYTFGSCDNGFWVKGSDVDTCLVTSDATNRQSCVAKLKLVKALLEMETSCCVNIIPAQVPIAKVLDDEKATLCDISVNNTAALENSLLISTLSRIDIRVRPLGRFIKYWASRRQINDRSKGTLSTYALLLQLIFYLQAINPPMLPLYRDIEINSRDAKKSSVCSASGVANPSWGVSEQEKGAHTDEERDNSPPGRIERSSEGELVDGMPPPVDGIEEDAQIFSGELRTTPFVTDISHIRNNIFKQGYSLNKQSLGELIFNFFMFYGDSRFGTDSTGYTLRVYDGSLTENYTGVLVLKCPLTGKNVNAFTTSIWDIIHKEFQKAKHMLLSGSSLEELCKSVDVSPLDSFKEVKALERAVAKAVIIDESTNL